MRGWSVCRWESAQAWLKENDMRILIAYGTSEGQTRKIANKVAARMHELGHDAHLFDTASLEETDVGSYDKVIVAGSVHEQRHQQSVEVFVMASSAELQGRPTLFLSVSLSAAFPEEFQRRGAMSMNSSSAPAGSLQSLSLSLALCATMNTIISRLRSLNMSC
jgi:hypothetical protein